MPDDETLDLEISTFASWARSLVGSVKILSHRQAEALLRPHLIRLVDPSRLDFFIDEVFYTLGRFEPENLGDYLTVVREGRGAAPRVTRVRRAALLENVLPAYSAAKHERGVIDWNDLAVRAADAEADRLYDIVIVDEAQDFSANQVRAVLRHLQQPSHNTTFVLDAIQRIYPQYFKWAEVGVPARPEAIHTLRENYRNTAVITDFAQPLVAGLPLEDDGTLPDFSACRRIGAKPVVIAGKYEAQLRYMLDHLVHTADLARGVRCRVATARRRMVRRGTSATAW